MNSHRSRQPAPEESDRAVTVAAWGAATSIGLVRQANEDAWGEADGAWFFVADGLGGEDGGELASTTAIASLLWRSDDQIPDWEPMLQGVNRDVHSALSRNRTPKGGTTVVGVCFNPSQVTVAHIGDSRAYRLRANTGSTPSELSPLELLTVDHSVAAELEAAGQSVELYNTNVGRADALTRYVGGETPNPPSVSQLRLAVGDRVMLCSDGVHGQIDDAVMAEAIALPDCGEAARELVRRSDAAGGRDNATAVVIEVGPPEGIR